MIQVELTPAIASEIAGLDVVVTHTQKIAGQAIDDYVRKVFGVALSLADLTAQPITVVLGEDRRTLDYSANDGSESGKIELGADGYSMKVSRS